MKNPWSFLAQRANNSQIFHHYSNLLVIIFKNGKTHLHNHARYLPKSEPQSTAQFEAAKMEAVIKGNEAWSEDKQSNNKAIFLTFFCN